MADVEGGGGHTNKRYNNKHGNTNQDSDKKEMKIVSEMAGKSQGLTYDTVKETHFKNFKRQ